MADEVPNITPGTQRVEVKEKQVTAAATPETLTQEIVLARSVTIKSDPNNASVAKIGTKLAGPFIELPFEFSAPESEYIDLKKFFIQVGADGEKVQFIYHSVGRQP